MPCKRGVETDLGPGWTIVEGALGGAKDKEDYPKQILQLKPEGEQKLAR